MARKIPIGKIKDTAVETIVVTVKDPVGMTKLAVGHAVGTALSTAAVVTEKVKGRVRPPAPKSEARPVAVPDEPAKKATTKTTSKKTSAKKPATKKAPTKKPTAKKSTTKKATTETSGQD